MKNPPPPGSRRRDQRQVVACGLFAIVVEVACFLGVERIDYSRELLVAAPGLVDVGTIPFGESVVVEVILQNRSRRDTTVVGGTSDCTCVTLDGLPITVPAGGQRPIPVRLSGAAAGPFERQVELSYGTRVLRGVVVTIRGRVPAPQ